MADIDLGSVAVQLTRPLHISPWSEADRARQAVRDYANLTLLNGLAALDWPGDPLTSQDDAPHLQRPDGWIYVGKDPLVRGLRDGLERGDLLVAPDLPLADAFRRELGRMVRIPTRRAMGTTWSHPDQRKGSHDDMTMAAAYAYWLAYTITAHGQAVRPLCRAHGGTE